MFRTPLDSPQGDRPDVRNDQMECIRQLCEYGSATIHLAASPAGKKATKQPVKEWRFQIAGINNPVETRISIGL